MLYIEHRITETNSMFQYHIDEYVKTRMHKILPLISFPLVICNTIWAIVWKRMFYRLIFLINTKTGVRYLFYECDMYEVYVFKLL